MFSSLILFPKSTKNMTFGLLGYFILAELDENGKNPRHFYTKMPRVIILKIFEYFEIF